MELRIAVSGDQKAADRLRHLGERARRAEPVLRTILGQLQDLERQRFETGRFKRLALSTRRRKAHEGLDPRPMRATGALMRSLTQDHAQDAIRTVHQDSLVFGTRVYYAAFHERGAGSPVRKPIAIPPKAREPIVRTILDFLTGAS